MQLLNDESFEDIKITFNEYMIQYYMHKEQFMDIFRAYNSVYNTSLVKNDSARAVEVCIPQITGFELRVVGVGKSMLLLGAGTT